MKEIPINARMRNGGVEKTVYFVRHGQSEDNISNVFQSKDSPLSSEGRMQALRLADRATKISFDALLSSPLDRAKETAEAISRTTGKSPEYTDLFVERVKPTSVDGKPFEDVDAVKVWREWEKSLCTPGLRVEDGENYEDLLWRAERALAYLTARSEGSLLVVTHGYFLRTIIAKMLFGDLVTPEMFERFHSNAIMENTGITVIRSHPEIKEARQLVGDPNWRLWIYNDHAHLG